MHWIALAVDIISVHVQRGREDELPEGTGAHECFARFADILAAIFLQVTLGVESSIEARRRDDALADLDGVDLAAADGQRALRTLERRGRGEDEQELVHFVYTCAGRCRLSFGARCERAEVDPYTAEGMRRLSVHSGAAGQPKIGAARTAAARVWLTASGTITDAAGYLLAARDAVWTPRGTRICAGDCC